MWSPHTSTFPPTSLLCTNALSQKAFFLTVCELPEIRTLKPQSQKDVFKGNTISSSQAEILMTRILSIKFKVHIRKSPFLEGTLRKIPEVHLIRLELAVKGFFVFCLFFFFWRRKWQPTPVFMPGKSHGTRSLVGYSPWGRKESDMTERLLCVCVCVKVFN